MKIRTIFFTIIWLVLLGQNVLSGELPIDELKKIQSNIHWVQKEIKGKRKSLKNKNPLTIRKRIESEILELDVQKSELESQFVEKISGVSLGSEWKSTQKIKPDIVSDVQELVSPVLESLKKVSSRPRKIEAYKQRLEILKAALEHREIAVKKLDSSLDDFRTVPIYKSIENGKKALEKEVKRIKVEIDTISNSLEKELANTDSVIGLLSGLIRDLFRTRGKNLLYAFLAALTLFFVLSIVKRTVIKLLKKRLKNLSSKALVVLYTVGIYTLSFIAFTFTLYLLHDWLLVTLIIILFSGLFWSSKQMIPTYMDELRLMMNLGPVREGQRLIWKGVPWRVDRIHFYSTLTNPLLQGGNIKVSIKELIGNHSRPIAENESWFPTKLNDWVEFDGGGLAKIIQQTPDHVVAKKLGGSEIHIPTSLFLSNGMQNLSLGFRIEKQFGIDYRHQNEISQTMMDELKVAIHESLQDHFRNSDKIYNLKVAFATSGESSLNFWVKIDCDGSLAHEKEVLGRVLEQGFLDFCTERQITIPFNQLTVHMAQNHHS